MKSAFHDEKSPHSAKAVADKDAIDRGLCEGCRRLIEPGPGLPVSVAHRLLRLCITI